MTANHRQTPSLKIQNNYLATASGAPFFMLADTAWELFHRLTHEEIDHYLTTRARQGFNVIFAVALSEFDGLSVPNAYGRVPLKAREGRFDPELPDTGGPGSYWDTVDYALRRAGELGLFIGLLPSWGDKWNQKWGKGPEIFTPENARHYGKWIGGRYGAYENLIWIMGGDRPIETDAHRAIIDQMAQGLREGDPGRHLMSFHPVGGHSSADFLTGADYMDFHMIQSSHAADPGYDSWKMLKSTADREAKPYLNGEPRYEDHPADFKVQYHFTWDAADTRSNLYWDVLQGASGHTYGNHCIWSFNRELQDYFPFRWQDALLHEGAETMVHAKTLRESRDYFSLTPAPGLAEDLPGPAAHIAAARGEGYAFIYTPLGAPISAHLPVLGWKTVKASWFDPRTGRFIPQWILPARESTMLLPPSSGKGNDWVLVLDRME